MKIYTIALKCNGIEKGEDYIMVCDETGTLRIRVSAGNKDVLQEAKVGEGLLLEKLWLKEKRVLATQFTAAKNRGAIKGVDMEAMKHGSTKSTSPKKIIQEGGKDYQVEVTILKVA